MFKFLHAADIHLDSPQLGLDRYEGAPVEECRRSTRRALENLVRLAVEERVAFVLIVGDLYDGDWPDYNTGLFFCARMAALRDAGIPVYLIRGNHDAANAMTRDLRPLDNVTFLDTKKPQTVYLERVDVAIHGQGFDTRAVRENLSLAYPRHDPGVFNVGMLHTCVNGGRDGHEDYAPCSLDDLRRRGYQYWALGHIHRREMLHRPGEPVIAFPGNIQGRHVRETGPKGCLLVTVDDAREARVEPRWLDVVRWGVCRVDADGAVDADDLLARVRERTAALLPGADDRTLALRVEVAGACRAHAEVAADWLYWTTEVRKTAYETGGGRIWVEKVVSRTRPPGEADVPGEGPLAELSALLDELRGDDDFLKALGDRALDDLKKKLPHDLLDGLDTADRLRDLLGQVGPLLLTRLNGGAAPVAAEA